MVITYRNMAIEFLQDFSFDILIFSMLLFKYDYLMWAVSSIITLFGYFEEIRS